MTKRSPIALTLLLSACLFTCNATADEGVSYKKGYVDSLYGQVHFHRAQPISGPGDITPIAFFHQNPRSAEEYRPLLKVVGRDRVAIAFDTPGYGESERPDAPLDMTQIAATMATALRGLGYGGGKGQVDVFGFHTGVPIGSEVAIQHPDLVRRVVLSGIPYFSPDERRERYANLPRDKTLTEEGSRILGRWAPLVNRRAEGVSLERAVRMYVEDIHSLDKWWYAYNAVWSYVPEERLPLITQPILVLQPHESLTERTLKARTELIPHADLIVLPTIVDDVFDTGPEEIGAALTGWLDSPK